MARQLLLKSLVSIFGDFVDGLTEENLKVGVWSGEILLENLRLNQEGIKRLNLPVDVQHGYIGSFRVSIPWSRLTSESVTVEIENVVLVASPGDPRQWDPEELRKKNLDAKRVLLEKATEAALAWSKSRSKTPEQKAESAGYFGRLATRIADNLFVFLKNIHIRFEDPISDPEGSLSAGVIVQDFQVQSTNEKFEATFVSRDDKKAAAAGGAKPGAIYKKILMRGFAVYWNTRSHVELGKLPLDQLLTEMARYEEITASSSSRTGEQMAYIVSPVTLEVKLTHNEGSADPATPVFAADVELPLLQLALQTEQYAQAMAIKTTFDRLNRMSLLLPYRPKKPVKEDPRAWWRYAYFCVKRATKSLDMAEIIGMFRKRRRYIHLFEKALSAQQAEAQAAALAKQAKSSKSPAAGAEAAALLAANPPLSAEEQAAFDMMEETVPLDTLVVWRTVAHTAMRRQAKLRKRKSRSIAAASSTLDASDAASDASGDTLATAKSSMSEAAAARPQKEQQGEGMGGWFSSWWGKPAEQGKGKAAAAGGGGAGKGAGADSDSSDEEGEEGDWQDVVDKGEDEEEVEEGDVSLDDLITQAGAALAAQQPPPPPPATAALFRVRLRTTSVGTVYAAKRAPLLELSSALALEAAQTGETLTASVRLPEFRLKDLYTPTALFTHIAKAGDGGNAGEAKEEGGTSTSATGADIFFLGLETSPRATSVRIRTRPLDLAYNKGWLARVLALRPPPEVREALAQRAVQNLNAATAVAASALGQSTLQADIEIAAPRIFVPLAESEDRGFLLLDTGHLSFRGGTLGEDPAAAAWDLKLSRIQSQLHMRKGDWLLGRLAQGGGGQLIEPFEIDVGLQMRGGGGDASSSGGNRSSPGKEADMSVTTALSPGIRGIFTPQLLKTTLAIVTDLGLPQLEEEEAGPVVEDARQAIGESALQLHRQVTAEGPALPMLAPSQSSRRSSAIDASAASAQSRPSAAAAAEEEEEEADPLHVKMEVRVEIPTVALELREDQQSSQLAPTLRGGNDGRLFLVAMDGFHMDYAARAYDSSIDLVLGALSIENLAGQAKQQGGGGGGNQRRFLAQSSSSSDADTLQGEAGQEQQEQQPGLVHFRMVSYEDRAKAPGYDKDKHDRVILLEFATLALKCDPDSLRLLAPFYGALMRFEEERPQAPPLTAALRPPGATGGLRRTMSVASNASTTTTLAAAAAELSARAAAAAALAAAQEGGKTMQVTARLARVSMELLAGGAVRRPVIMAEIAGLGAEVEMAEAMDVRVVLRTFEVTDTQPESRDNAIRKLICPKQGLAESGGPGSMAVTLPAGEAAEAVVAAEAGGPSKPLLVARVKEDKADAAYDIDLTLEDFTLNVLVEALLAAVDVSLENVNAVLAVLAAGVPPPQQEQQPSLTALAATDSTLLPPADVAAANARMAGLSLGAAAGGRSPPRRMGRIGEGDEERSDVDEEGKGEEGDHTRLSASQLQGVAAEDGEPPPMGLRVKVKLLNPGLILIENARNYDSRAVSMRGTFNVLYVSKAEGTAGTESLHVDAQGLEAFVDVVGGSAAGPVQIVTPFALGAHQKRQSEKGKLLVSEVLLNLDRVLTRVAYHDVMLVQGILGGLGDAMARFQATTAAAAAAAAAAASVGGAPPQGQEQGMVPGWTPEGGGEEFCQVTRPSGEGEEDEDDSEVGLPLSAADEELMRTKSTALSKLSVSLAGVEVLFINDYEGLEQPLLEIGLEDGHFSLEQCADAYQGDGGLRLRARFFNPTVLFWEPVLEPWALRCDVSTEAAGVVVAVATDRVLYLDLTEAFLQTLSRTYSLFLSATDTSSSSSLPATASLRSLPSGGDSVSLLGGGGGAGMTASPYIITNRTGLELVVDGGGGQVLVPPNATMPLELMKEGRPVRGLTDSMGDAGADGRRDVSAASGGAFVTVAFTGVVGEQRRPLSKLRADVPGTFLYALKPVQEAGGKVYPAPVLEETWENERSDRLTAHWRTPFMPTDRPRWSDEQGKRERKREDLPLPGPGWRWLDEWHVDMSYGRVGTEIDEEGWTYGVEFPGFSLNRIKRTHRDMDGVRRRRWIRTRIPVPPPIDDPTRPLAVAWRVGLLPDGRTELAVESTVTLVNETDVGLEVRAFVDPSAAAHAEGEEGGHRLDPVPPNGSVCLPLLLAYASTVRVRPLLTPPAVGGAEEDEPTSSYDWSPPFLISRGAGASEEVVVAQPSSSSSAAAGKTGAAACCPVALVVDATVSGGGLASVFLRPPFVVENLLPCHLLVSIAPHGPGTAHVKAIAPGVSAGIVSRPPRTSQDVRVKLLDYGWSQDQELGGAPDRFQNLKAFCCQHPMTGEELWLTGWAVRPKGPASRVRLQLQVYTRNWVVDRTGLGLGFAEDARPVSRASRVRTRTAPTASDVAGGIRPLSLRGSIGTSSCGAVEVLDLEVDKGRSTRSYRVAAVDNGSPIYTDRPCVFTGLPPRLRRKPAVLAPNDDKALVGDRLLSFRVSEGADVFLLYDVSGGANQPPLPAWIAQAGFAKAGDLPLVTVNTQRHEEGVIKFQAFHKHVPASAPWVALGGNGSTRNNYVVIVAKEALPASSASETASTVMVPSAAEWGHWEEEAALGLLLYDPRNHKQPRMCVCVGEEVAWSKPLDVEHVVDRGVFEVNTEQACYEMSLSVSVCPGVFYRTKQVTVAPRFVVVNCMDAEVALRQTDMDDRVVRLQPHQRTPFHFAPRQANKKREVQLMLPGQTGWSYGGVGLENVGGTAVLLPHDERDPERHAPVVVHVEVKLAESEEECAVVIALWRPTPPEPPLYAVHNYTPFPVQFVQMDVRASKPRWALPPGRTSVYGWEFPTMRHVLFLRVLNPALPERKLCCEVYLDKVLDGDVIDMGRGHGKIYLKVLAENGTKVLKIVTARSMLLPPRQPSQRELTVRLSLPGVGLSLVGADEEEGRREIGFLFIQDVRAEYLQGTREREVELKVKSVQLDNHVRNAIFPVILCPRTLKTDQDFVHLALLAETDTTPSGAGTHTTIRYLALRVLAMDVQLDLRSVLRYLHFFQQVALLDYDRATAELHPARFVGGLRDFYGYAEPLPWVDVGETCRAVTNARVYFERIDLHPLAVALSFVQTVADKRVGFGGNVLEVLRNLATISRAPVQLRSFQVEHAMETPASFSHIVLAHYKRQAFAQVLTIAGSLSTLGSPVDLVTSVGTGVKDFFYEPINGLVHSPKEFAKGLKKGTTSLLKGVVSGALNSVAGVGDTLNRNVAMLAADREYAQEREQRRQAATAGGTGIVDGLKGGGESLVRGFADGIGGVFTAPVKEARTGGIGGFIKGVGKGVVGLAVKPLVGVSDAVVSVIQGASQAAQDLEVHNPVRPRRALPRLSRTGEKVLTDYSLQASQVQEKVDQGDAYVCHVSLKDKDVIFTDQYLTIANHAKGSEWKKAWRDIAWCELSDFGGVMIHLYRDDDSGGSNNRGTLLAVQDADEAYYIYELLLQHAHKMGNGAQMPPLEQALLGQEAGIGDDAAGVGAGGLLGGYRWGSKNDQDLRCRRLRSWDIVARARERLTKMWDTWPELDDCVWRVINDWTKNHRGPLNFRKCLALLVINKGSTGVQIQGTDFRDGSEIHIIETQRYDKAGRVIRPQDGAVLVLAWSHIPTLVKKAHIAFRIETTAFKGEVTDKGATVQAKPGWEAGFLEKTRKSDYVKYVVVVG